MGIGRKKTLLEQAQDVVSDVLETAISSAHDAAAKAEPLLAQGKAKAADAVTEGKAKAAPLVSDTKAALKGEKAEKKKGGKLKKTLFIGGLLAAGGVIFNKLRSNQEAANWQTSYVPTPPPTTKPTPAASGIKVPDNEVTDTPVADEAAAAVAAEAVSDDPGGASPDEAVSDAVKEPHEATTPDEPVESVDLEEAKQDKE